jgi:hypothetical protein
MLVYVTGGYGSYLQCVDICTIFVYKVEINERDGLRRMLHA